MTRPVDQVVNRLRAGARVDASNLAIRIDALGRFRRAAEGILPDELLEPARIVAERAGQRLALSRTHTVVAVAGPTGSGKSSLFNALAGVPFSPVGVRRPTTGAAFACVWGPHQEAAALLDWLGVPHPNRSSVPVLDSADQASLRGLVLLDLPDFDSVQRDHAAEVERLLGLVDLVVWVLDPQKYADRSVHERQLRPLCRYQDLSVVALNQADRLGPDALARVLADLRRLLADDGLAGVPIVATSAVDRPSGTTRLRAVLVPLVAERMAGLRRLAADLDAVVADLAGLVSPTRYDDSVDALAERALVDELAEVAGVPQVLAQARAAYRRRAVVLTGWPPARWVRRLWARSGRPELPERPEATTVPGPVAAPAGAARRAAAGLAVRALADRASAGLPYPWPEAVDQAARFHLDELPATLSAAVAATAVPGARTVPWWWRLAAAGQRLLLATSAGALAWLLVAALLRAVALPVTHSRLGPLPAPVVLALAALAGGAVLAGGLRAVVGWASHRQARQTEDLLRAAVTEVARRLVVAPVRTVLGGYAEARAGLRGATAPEPAHPTGRFDRGEEVAAPVATSSL